MSIATPTPAPYSADDFSRLSTQVTGAVVTPGEPAYDQLRACWNLAFDIHPSLIVEAATADDVAAAMAFARAWDLGVAVQATGHGLAGACDGGLLIVTRRLDTVTVDPVAGTARVGAGATWAPVLAAAQAHGLAPLAGSAPHVGAVGYTLGGGMGWLARRHGLSADKVRSFEVVTPDGRLRWVSAAEDPELFWALRGAGAGSLAVVTAMEIELVEVAEVYAGNLLYPVEHAEEVFARFRDWVADVPDELTAAVAVMNYPPFDVVPEPLRGRSFAVVRGCWCGPVDQGAALVDEWRRWRTPEIDQFGPMPFADMAAISQDPVDPVPAVVAGESLTDLDAAARSALIEHAVPAGGPPALIFCEVRHGGGALARTEGGAGRARLGRAAFMAHAAGILDPAAPDRLPAHLASLRAALAPARADHAYLNFLEGQERRDRAREAFTAQEWDRLAAVKAAVDPEGRMAYGLPL